jgi:CYTH domain-containing protein
MGKEIERKFLWDKPTPFDNIFKETPVLIRQGYVFVEDHKHLRVRVYDTDDAEMCLKYTSDVVRDEYELDMLPFEALAIFNKCEWRLEKKRYSVKDIEADVKYDFDEYPNGMRVVEVEFKTREAAENFKVPDWLGNEISGVYEYSNITLAKQLLAF